MMLRWGFVAWSFTLIFPSCAIDPVTTLDCHRRHYSLKVEQKDAEGLVCWDQVDVMSCWGRCDSNEIADWKFPYKKSHHPVCLHATTQSNTVTLRNCDPNITPGTEIYTFQESASCACSFCRSSVTSCEGLRYRGARQIPSRIKPPRQVKKKATLSNGRLFQTPLKYDELDIIQALEMINDPQTVGIHQSMNPNFAPTKKQSSPIYKGQIPFLEYFSFADFLVDKRNSQHLIMPSSFPVKKSTTMTLNQALVNDNY